MSMPDCAECGDQIGEGEEQDGKCPECGGHDPYADEDVYCIACERRHPDYVDCELLH